MSNDYNDVDLEEGDATTVPNWASVSYEVFNPDHTVGVACDRNGEIIGMHIDDDALDNGDTWLAAEILRLAKLAYQKSRLGMRTEMDYNGTPGYIIDSFGLPNETDYRAMETAEYGMTL